MRISVQNDDELLDKARRITKIENGSGRVRLKTIIVSLALVLFAEIITLAPANTQEHETVEIYGYTHRACLVDGEKLRPMLADNGYRSEHRRGSHWTCEDTINSGVIGCERAVLHVSSWQNDQYPECLKIFRSWVPECIAHYEAQRHKCKALQTKTNKQASSDKQESSECETAKQALAVIQSTCNEGDSMTCGSLLAQVSELIKYACQ